MATPYAEDSLARSFQKRAALTFGRECDGEQSRLANSARVFSLSGSSQAQGRARVLRVGPPAQNDQRCCQAQKPWTLSRFLLLKRQLVSSDGGRKFGSSEQASSSGGGHKPATITLICALYLA